MSAGDVERFLCQVLCVHDLSGIDLGLFVSNDGLLYEPLLRNERVKKLLKTNYLFKKVFGGCACPWQLANKVVESSHMMAPLIFTSTILRLLPEESYMVKSYHRTVTELPSYERSLEGSLAFAMGELNDWLAMRWNFPSEESSPFRIFTAGKANYGSFKHQNSKNVMTGSLPVEDIVTNDTNGRHISTFDHECYSSLVSDHFQWRLMLSCDIIVLDNDVRDMKLASELVKGILTRPNAPNGTIVIASCLQHDELAKLQCRYYPFSQHAILPMMISAIGKTVHMVCRPSPNASLAGGNVKYVLVSASDDIATLEQNLMADDIIVASDNVIRDKRIYSFPNLIIPWLSAIPSLGNTYIQMVHDRLNSAPGSMQRELATKRCMFYKHAMYAFVKARARLDAYPAGPSRLTKSCVVLIDNRMNALSIMSMVITLGALSDSQCQWDPIIITQSKNTREYEGIFDKFQIGVEVMKHPLLELAKFDIESYNELLKSGDFWKTISRYNKCLLIQDDGMVLFPGIDRFSEYDYVGAPWMSCTQNEELERICPSMVGNGGLSLRNVGVMQGVCYKYHNESRLLFNKNLQPIPEDVYFAKYTFLEKNKVPSVKEASYFACEQVYNSECIGVHKLWAYCSMDAVNHLCQRILKAP